jgi:hypothetical protein
MFAHLVTEHPADFFKSPNVQKHALKIAGAIFKNRL